ncbi:MAG: isocitrate/isopropylmalate dehydrogenase family protein [Thermoplasmata archaeon]
MPKHRIAWLPGDGVGPEVLEAARMVLDATGLRAEYLHGDIGWDFWKSEGDPLPARTLDLLKKTDCAFLGAVTSKPDPEAMRELAPALRKKGLTYRSAVLRIRQLFDLYICLRPCRAYPGNPGNSMEGIDIDIFRENTEGLYVGVEWWRVPDGLRRFPGMEKIPESAAVSIRAVTPRASRRIAMAAFEHARRRGRKRVTAVHKANVLRATCGTFLEAVREVAAEFPGIEYEEMHIDACAARMVRDPLHFEVVVTTNLFGDILSDLCAQLVGGLGFAPSASIGESYALFEPTHGSAPDIAGKGIANPAAAILAAGLMLDWLGERKKAEALERAVAEVIREGRVRTPDAGGSASTMEFAAAVAEKIE